MQGEKPRRLATLSWPWRSEERSLHVILVSDRQLLNLAEHPDEAVEKVFPQDPEPVSLREYCRRGAERGATKLRVAFDYFFGGSSRSLYPDTEDFQIALKKIHDVAQEFGIGLEPSILSPLELGVGYRAKTGESGRWLHYREGLRDPQTGQYSVTMWQHTRWCNNKGPTPITLKGVRAFAFCERRIPNTRFFAVDPDSIVELDPPEVEAWPGALANVGALDGGTADSSAMFRATRVRVSGQGGPPGLDRVLVVLLYETVEMDYCSPRAAEFLDDLVASYHQRGITLAGLYSDEMHIQQDWSYHSHLEHGQFALRYVSPGFERVFSERHGERYADLVPYMIYFTSHQHDFLPTHEPKLPAQHVFGPSDEAIAATLRFRRDYYDLLEGAVVDLMVEAREKFEEVNGCALDAYYHSTWAESPTCDLWAVGGVPMSWTPEEHRRRYLYTPDFVWSNTVQQAAAACANYFKWNEFLTGGNDDTAEGGYADRNYYGRALACSLAALNRRPLASAGMWGMPREVRRRMAAVSAVYGAGGHPVFRSVADYAPRSIDVLFVYPQDLVAVEERFGSWMVLYGYANYATAEKIVQYGEVTEDGWLRVGHERYRTLAVLYEPFPDTPFLELLREFAERGGTVIWTSIPPLDTQARQTVASMCGLSFLDTPDPLGLPLPGRQVCFKGGLKPVPPQTILTDFVVDRVFPVEPGPDAEVVATLQTGGPEGVATVGVRRCYPGGGQAVCLGFRPEDDQSASTGTEIRTWFEVLRALGSYAEDDHPVVVSRTTEYLATKFANGAIAVCPHYRRHPENWPGGFYRDAEIDRVCLEQNPLPDDSLDLNDLSVAGQRVTYRGRHAVAWRFDSQARALRAFAGAGCCGITINDVIFEWSADEVDVGWHPLGAAYATDDVVPLYRVWVGSPGSVELPLSLPGEQVELWQGSYVGSQRGGARPKFTRLGYGIRQVNWRRTPRGIRLDVGEELVGHWLYVVTPI